jgi:hypothetical protein
MVMDKTLAIASVAASCGADAEFIDLPGLRERFGIRRSLAYVLISEGVIRSVCLRRRGQIKGKRLIDVASVRNFLASQPTDVDPQLAANCRKALHVRREKEKAEKAKRKVGDDIAAKKKRASAVDCAPFEQQSTMT